MSDTRVRLFIAMPATNMGSSAEWKDPEKITTHLFGKVAESLQIKLDKQVELVIEKDKVLGGPIHASMFYDAMESDVYIADLTGNNPNVYLELGARWALRDSITVVVRQNVDEILFNAAASRAIQYSKDPEQLKSAIAKIVQAIIEGLAKADFCDSPVRKNAAIVTYDRNFIDQIKSEVQQLRTQAASRAAATPEDQLRLLREADTQAGLMESLTETGISDVYTTREAAAERMFQDIQNSSQSCWISCAVYIRSLILPESHRRMTIALEGASNRAGKRGDRYRLSFCSLSDDISSRSLAGKRNVSVLECWRQRELDSTIAPLQQRIKRASINFETLTREIMARSPAIRPERRFFRDYPIPHSLVVIDDSIAYVSFYDWGTPTGRRALTIRFQGGQWGSKFVEESHILRSRYSYRDYRVIAFDFDGVIADSMSVQAEAWRHATIAASSHVQEQLMYNFWKGAAGSRIFENTGLESASSQQLRQTKDAEFQRLETTIKVFEHSQRVLNSLKQSRHYKLAIATTAENSRVESFLKRHSLAHCFDYVITDYDVRHGKPHEEMLLTIAEYFRCQPWQICLVGDTHTDYAMSSNAGTDFVLFQSHEAHGVTVECVTARTWQELEAILLGKNSPNGKT